MIGLMEGKAAFVRTGGMRDGIMEGGEAVLGWILGKLKNDPSAQLLDIRDNQSLSYLRSPNLKILNKIAVPVEFVEGEDERFVKKALANFSDPGNTILCILDKEKRRTVALTDSGQISAVEVDDGYRGPYHLQFITMEPSSLFLPVMLQTDMVFYVHSGRGQLTYHDGKDKRDQVEIERGDIFRLRCGSVFYVQSYANPMREKLRIFATFTSKINENIQLGYFGAYSKISDLVLGFDERVLQVAFKVTEEEMKGITMAKKLPSIVHMSKNTENDEFEWREGIIQALVGGSSHSLDNKKGKTFNILKVNPDVKNCNGWSLAVTSKDFHALKGSDVGAFMVNLTKGSMMGPHWNPRATEIAVVLQGQGMVRVVCPSDAPQCKNARFRVKEGDVFAVPRFHPMAQISFNKDSLVFMGFSTMARYNRPQFLAGKWSVLRTIDEDILAMSFNVSNTTIKHFISAQSESVILECASCAEYEEKKMEEDIEKEKQEEEEEARRREEEEARKRREEEEARKREAARKREEEEREKEQEEARKQEEEREARRKEEKEARKREEEEETRRREGMGGGRRKERGEK
ncbi:hypothetical protein MRB53_004792 [Persea americana]|uniref:Uncharacterized protein n=1 Tax=Persea americana TaxID=3435 RepID=A0ACC2MBE2_PERAE|nr:hypothetical protein MRB53_004792 [Persea americana]